MKRLKIAERDWCYDNLAYGKGNDGQEGWNKHERSFVNLKLYNLRIKTDSLYIIFKIW